MQKALHLVPRLSFQLDQDTPSFNSAAGSPLHASTVPLASFAAPSTPSTTPSSSPIEPQIIIASPQHAGHDSSSLPTEPSSPTVPTQPSFAASSDKSTLVESPSIPQPCIPVEPTQLRRGDRVRNRPKHLAHAFYERSF
ncbi:unnamed protein product [Linum trigynum]|uniref:Uncharacterized protein n=1 Tax=Linum trigynum TaxID=586398 RepID=A0AAV2FAM8_9ROSI